MAYKMLDVILTHFVVFSRTYPESRKVVGKKVYKGKSSRKRLRAVRKVIWGLRKKKGEGVWCMDPVSAIHDNIVFSCFMLLVFKSYIFNFIGCFSKNRHSDKTLTVHNF